MFWNKKSILKKGFVMIYTMIIGLIVILIVSYIATLTIKEKNFTTERKNEVEQKPYNRESTEYLFSEINKIVLQNVSNPTKRSIQIFFCTREDVRKLGSDDYFIIYDTKSDKFIVNEPFKLNQTKMDEYNYDFANGKIDFIYDHSEYVLR
ncbi:MAG: hypothetical protein PHX70_12360 [Clostridium sp.]|nr:hypothetical protein [Clostridium sp.]